VERGETSNGNQCGKQRTRQSPLQSLHLLLLLVGRPEGTSPAEKIAFVSFVSSWRRFLTHIERVLIQLNAWLLATHVDRHDIEATGTLDQVVPRHIVQPDARHPSSLEQRDRLGARTELTSFAGLDLDKHNRLAIARDDVQFSAAAPIPAGKNCVPSTLKLLAGEIFA
jgi:hypothetical protein